ncbi:MAG: hypothetical protein KIS68_07815 [Bauldia sp.]|nr:hypothetical protein [Bauldia sp.]
MKAFSRRLAIAAFAVGLAGAVGAQPVELAERYTGDGWSISHPSGWIVDVQALPALATDADALATMQRNAPLPPGGITIGIVPPGMYGALGLDPSATAEAAIVEIAEFFGGEGTVEPFTGTSHMAFARALEGTTRVPPMTTLIVAEVSGGVVTFLVVAEDFAAVTPLVEAIVSSFSVP